MPHSPFLEAPCTSRTMLRPNPTMISLTMKDVKEHLDRMDLEKAKARSSGISYPSNSRRPLEVVKNNEVVVEPPQVIYLNQGVLQNLSVAPFPDTLNLTGMHTFDMTMRSRSNGSIDTALARSPSSPTGIDENRLSSPTLGDEATNLHFEPEEGEEETQYFDLEDSGVEETPILIAPPLPSFDYDEVLDSVARDSSSFAPEEASTPTDASILNTQTQRLRTRNPLPRSPLFRSLPAGSLRATPTRPTSIGLEPRLKPPGTPSTLFAHPPRRQSYRARELTYSYEESENPNATDEEYVFEDETAEPLEEEEEEEIEVAEQEEEGEENDEEKEVQQVEEQEHDESTVAEDGTFQQSITDKLEPFTSVSEVEYDIPSSPPVNISIMALLNESAEYRARWPQPTTSNNSPDPSSPTLQLPPPFSTTPRRVSDHSALPRVSSDDYRERYGSSLQRMSGTSISLPIRGRSCTPHTSQLIRSQGDIPSSTDVQVNTSSPDPRAATVSPSDVTAHSLSAPNSSPYRQRTPMPEATGNSGYGGTGGDRVYRVTNPNMDGSASPSPRRTTVSRSRFTSGATHDNFSFSSPQRADDRKAVPSPSPTGARGTTTAAPPRFSIESVSDTETSSRETMSANPYCPTNGRRESDRSEDYVTTDWDTDIEADSGYYGEGDFPRSHYGRHAYHTGYGGYSGRMPPPATPKTPKTPRPGGFLPYDDGMDSSLQPQTPKDNPDAKPLGRGKWAIGFSGVMYDEAYHASIQTAPQLRAAETGTARSMGPPPTFLGDGGRDFRTERGGGAREPRWVGGIEGQPATLVPERSSGLVGRGGRTRVNRGTRSDSPRGVDSPAGMVGLFGGGENVSNDVVAQRLRVGRGRRDRQGRRVTREGREEFGTPEAEEDLGMRATGGW